MVFPVLLCLCPGRTPKVLIGIPHWGPHHRCPPPRIGWLSRSRTPQDPQGGRHARLAADGYGDAERPFRSSAPDRNGVNGY